MDKKTEIAIVELASFLSGKPLVTWDRAFAKTANHAQSLEPLSVPRGHSVCRLTTKAKEKGRCASASPFKPHIRGKREPRANKAQKGSWGPGLPTTR